MFNSIKIESFLYARSKMQLTNIKLMSKTAKFYYQHKNITACMHFK